MGIAGKTKTRVDSLSLSWQDGGETTKVPLHHTRPRRRWRSPYPHSASGSVWLCHQPIERKWQLRRRALIHGWGGHLKSPPYTLHSSLEPAEPPALSHRKLAIVVAGAIAVLVVSIVGVLLATYLGRAACVQRDAFSYLPPQVNVQNEASLLLALSELGEQGTAPGITCDLRNHLMVYHGQPEGCVARRMEASEPLPSCQELESYFQAVLKNATLGITEEVQLVGTGPLGGLATLLCSNRPTYLVSSSTASPRNIMTRRS
ncbi:uncharacterized protein LOC123032886 [Varanus komodoensis]|uniref:uncharacterized protein LOC123032886 n=1 Tax=Varanus komodoensis TaxID=61221 RepID=UPI001CF7C1BE|nr:uncharacterized protein LOC123032886 [Varanus komodoensis]